jgi:hypothetical protein
MIWGRDSESSTQSESANLKSSAGDDSFTDSECGGDDPAQSHESAVKPVTTRSRCH